MLYGSERLFYSVKKILEENRLPEKLDELQHLAELFRRKAEESILGNTMDKEEIKKLHLFYSAEEIEEFE